MKLIWVLIVLLIGFALGALFAYNRWHKPNQTTMILGADLKVIPHVNPGETLSWAHPVKVSFQYGGGLCTGNDQHITDCTVGPKVGMTHLRYYTYTCDNPNPCQDPDAGGGSDVIILGSGGQPQTPQTTLTATGPTPIPIHVYCQSGASMVDPPTLNLTHAQAVAGQTLVFEPAGTAGDNWAAGPNLSPVCGVSTYNDSNATNLCTVLANAPATTTYTVTTQNCSNGTGTINVAQN